MNRLDQLRWLLWAYIGLLIFEGALRKWIFPGLSTPLLIVRDPLCLAALWLGWPLLRKSQWFTWIAGFWGIGITAILLSQIGGHGDLPTALYGARILVLHFPLIFLLGLVFNRNDVWACAKAFLILSIPMTALIAFQYSLPQSHFLNIAPGGEGSAGFGGALGKFRPPGTFSFINGLTDYYALVATFLASWLVSGPKPMPRWIWLAAACLIVALPLSISRTLLFNYVLIASFCALASMLAGKAVQNFIAGAAVIGVLAVGISQSEEFQGAYEVFSARWEEANWAEGQGEGVLGVLSRRVGGGMLEALNMTSEVPLFGAGIGLGSNVGAMRAVGQKEFAVAEASWPAMVGELGPLLGLALILLRLALGIHLFLLAWHHALRGNPLPLTIAAVAIPAMVIGQTGQPTALGFLVVSCGLLLAACQFPLVSIKVSSPPAPSLREIKFSNFTTNIK